jgi:DNA-binding IscR family transcriptional regulator
MDLRGTMRGMGLDPYSLNPRREKCARCGEVAKGSAWINDERYCHSDDPYPTCYMRESWEQASKRWRRAVETKSFAEVLEHLRLDEADLLD